MKPKIVIVDKRFVEFVKITNQACKHDRAMSYQEYMKDKLPDYVNKVAKQMNEAGHKVYLVGGAVRNTLMNYHTQNEELDKMISWLDNFEQSFAAGKIKMGDKVHGIL